MIYLNKVGTDASCVEHSGETDPADHPHRSVPHQMTPLPNSAESNRAISARLAASMDGDPDQPDRSQARSQGRRTGTQLDGEQGRS
jgi:hypothetical protein